MRASLMHDETGRHLRFHTMFSSCKQVKKIPPSHASFFP